MKRSFKLLSTICIIALLATVVAACGGSNSPKNTGKTPDTTNTDKPSSKDAPTLVWWQIGGTPLPANYKQAIDKMNEYTAEKIGVKIDIKVASWGEWDSKINTIVNTGEPFDIMFTNSGKYSKQVAMGAFADITDLVQTEAPELFNLIPEQVWNGTKIGGKVYSVPTYKDSSLTQYWVYDDKLVQKYSIDIATLRHLKTWISLSAI